MSIPSHNLSCLTKAVRFNCQDCNRPVWYFKCSCGSKIFFDDLGWPWPLHHCKNYEIRESIELIKSIERYTDEEIYLLIESYQKKHSLQLSDEIFEIIEYVIGKRKFKFSTTEVDCTSDIDFISGQIMEINRSINFYKKFHLDKSSIFSMGLLSILSKDDFDELIIRENPDKKNHSNQYRIFIEHKKLKSTQIKIGNKILATVSIIDIPVGKIWRIDTFKNY